MGIHTLDFFAFPGSGTLLSVGRALTAIVSRSVIAILGGRDVGSSAGAPLPGLVSVLLQLVGAFEAPSTVLTARDVVGSAIEVDNQKVKVENFPARTSDPAWAAHYRETADPCK